MEGSIVNTVQTASQDWTITDYATKQTPSGWESVFNHPATISELKDLEDTISERMQKKGFNDILPAKNKIFRVFHLVRPENVKVVIFGSGPTRVHNQGMAFSSSKMEIRSAEMDGIYQELKYEYPEYQVPYHGCLDEWARQGVLLLNISFTADLDEEPHGKVWLGIIDRVIKELSKKHMKMIYALWGTKIQDAIMPLLDNKCIILNAGYPRYVKHFGERGNGVEDSRIDRRDKQLIESMKDKNSSTFLGINPPKNNLKKGEEENKFVFLECGHFRKINEILVSKDKKEIKWQLSYQ